MSIFAWIFGILLGGYIAYTLIFDFSLIYGTWFGRAGRADGHNGEYGGKIAEVATQFEQQTSTDSWIGKVSFQGEIWQAELKPHSKGIPIKGEKVRVLGRKGMVLEVEMLGRSEA